MRRRAILRPFAAPPPEAAIRIVVALLAVAAVGAVVGLAVAPALGIVVAVIAAVTVLPVLVRRQEP